MTPTHYLALLSVTILCLLPACRSSRNQLLETEESQVMLRSIQSRVFDTTDRTATLRTIMATLQDLGFVIDDADEMLGLVSATKLDRYAVRMTVTVRPRGKTQLLVRANAQYNLQAVEDPEPYQQFYQSLSKSMFLAGDARKTGVEAWLFLRRPVSLRDWLGDMDGVARVSETHGRDLKPGSTDTPLTVLLDSTQLSSTVEASICVSCNELLEPSTTVCTHCGKTQT